MINRIREPYGAGFMKGGFFAWPIRDFICDMCKEEFQSHAAKPFYCEPCRKINRRRIDRKAQNKRKDANRNVHQPSTESHKKL